MVLVLFCMFIGCFCCLLSFFDVFLIWELFQAVLFVGAVFLKNFRCFSMFVKNFFVNSDVFFSQ